MARELVPNSTQIPDVILDFWLAELSGAELKVVLYIARRTFGFGKESDNISLTQICSGIRKRDGTVLDTGTGLSRSSVARAIKTLEAQGIILRKINLNETGNEHEESTYSLNLDWQPKGTPGAGGKKVVPKSNHPVSKKDYRWSQNRTTRSPEIEPGVVPKSNPQETEIQETDQDTAARETAAVLVEELVSQGVNRSKATQLAHQMPERCRRQLEYLPYHAPRENPGGWLVEAIEGDYGPSPHYLQTKASKKTESTTRLAEALKTAQETHYKAFLSSYMCYLGEKCEPACNNDPDLGIIGVQY